MGLLNMLRQTVSAVASSGTGALTLSTAQAGYLTAAQAGAVNGRSYSYSIIEGAKFEHGRGTYNSAGPSMSRDVVYASSVASAYNTLETFTTACILLCSPLAEDLQELKVLDKGNSGTSTQTFDVSKAKVQKLTNTGAHTWAFSFWSAQYDEIQIQCVNAGANAITLPTINWILGDGTVSTTFANLGVTLQASGVNTFVIWTYDGGTTLYGRAI